MKTLELIIQILLAGIVFGAISRVFHFGEYGKETVTICCIILLIVQGIYIGKLKKKLTSFNSN